MTTNERNGLLATLKRLEDRRDWLNEVILCSSATFMDDDFRRKLMNKVADLRTKIGRLYDKLLQEARAV